MSGSFLLQCKQNYLEGITPSNELSNQRDGYKRLVSIAKDYFTNNKYAEFSNYFIEGQYFISLWAAHMLLEYGEPNKELMRTALDVITEHANNPLAPIVAEEEKKWLSVNAEKFFT